MDSATATLLGSILGMTILILGGVIHTVYRLGMMRQEVTDNSRRIQGLEQHVEAHDAWHRGRLRHLDAQD